MRVKPGSPRRDPLTLGSDVWKPCLLRGCSGGKAQARSLPVPAGEENQRRAHPDSGLWGYGGRSCVLGCPGSHLTSQSGNYSEENSFRVEILLTSAPVAESVCHLSPQFLSFFDILSSVRTFDGCHLSIPVSFGILHKTLNLSAIESK